MNYIFSISLILAIQKYYEGKYWIEVYPESKYGISNLSFRAQSYLNRQEYILSLNYEIPLKRLGPIIKYTISTCNIRESYYCGPDNRLNMETNNNTLEVSIATQDVGVDYSILFCVVYENSWATCMHRIVGMDHWPMKVGYYAVTTTQNKLIIIPSIVNHKVKWMESGNLSLYFEWKVLSILSLDDVQYWAVFISYFTSFARPTFLPKSVRNHTYYHVPIDQEVEIKLCLVPRKGQSLLEHLCEYQFLQFKHEID